MQGLLSILFFSQKFSKSINTGAQMLYLIYDMTLEYFEIKFDLFVCD